MRKLWGVLVMSVFLALAACGGQTLQTRTFTSSQNVTIPAGVTSLSRITGYGARGYDAGDYYVEQYDRYFYNNQTRRQDGVVIQTNTVYDGTYNGSTPANYCGQTMPLPESNTLYSATQTCFNHIDTSYWDSYPAGEGAPAQGFGKSFPGSLGDTTPSTTGFTNVPVNPGTYNIYVPPGGRITIEYYQ